MEKRRRIISAILMLILIVFVAIIRSDVTSASNKSTNIIYHNTTGISTKPDENAKKIQALRDTYNNNDIQGELIIEGAGIDEIVMKSSDNDYYLTHDESGNSKVLGSITMDYRTSIGDKKILIYGHSSIYQDVPFNRLEKYYDKNFYDNHKYITLIGLDKTYTYEIFSVYVETKDFTYMNLKIDDDTYNEYLKRYKERSLYNTEVEINKNDEILILQTCSNSKKYSKYKKKYLLVIAKKINNREV